MNKRPGRPDQGKTKTIKQRMVTVYLPTENTLEEWRAEAGLRHVPLSRFVYEVVDNAIRKKEFGMTPNQELESKLSEALAENKRLKERLEQVESSLKQADVTIARYRAKISTALPANIDKGITRKLAGLFLDRRIVLIDEIPAALGIRLDDARGMARIRDSLNYLSACGLIEEDLSEGRWKAGTGHRVPTGDKGRRY